MPALLLQQILRAHHIFLAHHSSSLSELLSRVSREKFCGFLKRFWNSFLGNWDVLLHGNPAVEIYNGIKLSAGGELGIGVGEEEWGSGEREVLECFIERTEGLVDLMVSRFEKAPEQNLGSAKSLTSSVTYRGTGNYPQPTDGLIFSGIGALTRPSIKNVSAWVEWIAMYGADAYGVRDNPSSNPRRNRARAGGSFRGAIRERKGSHRVPQSPDNIASASSGTSAPRIPAPIVRPSATHSTSTSPLDHALNGSAKQARLQGILDPEGNTTSTEIMKYLTLGMYGSSWGIPAGRPVIHQRISSLRADADGIPSTSSYSEPRKQDASTGHFLIGLVGDLEDDGESDADGSKQDQSPFGQGDTGSQDSNCRILMRHLHLECMKPELLGQALGAPRAEDSVDRIYHTRLRVVVYVQDPFIFTFFFEPETDSLAMPSFYRSLHHQLGPLQRPLLKSTDPDQVSRRLWDAASTKSTIPIRSSQPIRDLVYDPERLTVHTSIPNIPEPALSASDVSSAWTRIEALSVHSQILNNYVSTRRHSSELERTCKTSRGWWVVWMRLPHPPIPSVTHGSSYREAVLIRKASDYVAPKPKTSGLGFGISIGGESSGAGWGPAKLAEGIGIDARQYIDGLLSLNR